MSRQKESLARAIDEYLGGRSLYPPPPVPRKPEKCSHEFVNTGMRWSYCKRCDKDGEFIDGRYLEKEV